MLLIEVRARLECFLIAKPSRALSLAAFVEVLERISEDCLRMQVQVAAAAGNCMW